MHKVIKSAILAAGLIAAVAGTAEAKKSSAYCAQVAQATVDNYTHPVGNAVLGCAAGGILGNLLTKGNTAATAGGCAAGAAGGLGLTAVQRKRVYNQAYYNCMGTP